MVAMVGMSFFLRWKLMIFFEFLAKCPKVPRGTLPPTWSVFRLLQANPEMVLSNSTMKQSDVEAIRHGKKRALLPRFEPPLFLSWWGLSLLYHLAILFWLLRSTNALIAVCVLFRHSFYCCLFASDFLYDQSVI